MTQPLVFRIGAHATCAEIAAAAGSPWRDGEPWCSAQRPTGMDDVEWEALRAEGLDPDDPAVAAAIDFVRWELR